MKGTLLLAIRSCLYIGAILILNSQTVSGQMGTIPELMYFKFDTVIAGAVPNDANPATRVGTANAPIVGGHTVGGTGQFGKGFIGSLGSSSTDYLNTGWVTNLSGSWTISLWLNIPNPPTTRYYFGDNTAGSFRCFTGGAASTGLRLTGPFTLTTTTIQPTPKVVHYVYDASTSTLTSYINGVVDVSITTTPSIVSTTGPFKVGAYGTGNSFEGTIDEFRMYNRALSAAEVALTWNVALPYSPCASPTNVAASNITVNSAEVSWDSVPSVTGYEYDVTTSATPPASGAATTDTMHLVGGLTSATTYYIHVRVNCGGIFSNWTTSSFTTDTCPATTASVLNIGPNGATVSWTAEPGVAGYEYAVTTSATPPASGTATTGTSQAVSGLTAMTSYYAHVRSDCGGTFSSWDSEPFTTDSCGSPEVTVGFIGPNSADFSWNNPNGATSFEYAFGLFANPPSSGTTTNMQTHSETGLDPNTTYHFHLRSFCDADSSEWTSTAVTTNPVGVYTESNREFTLNVFPNPVSKSVMVTISGPASANRKLVIIDNTGREIRSFVQVPNSLEIDMSNVESGMYILKYSDEHRNTETTLMKQ